MVMQKWKNGLFNGCILMAFLLAFLLLFGSSIKTSSWLQVVGRMHPLVLHFPVVLIILAFIWELFIYRKENFIIKETADWILLGASFTALVAALMGFFLSREEGYTGEGIIQHKWSGGLLALFCTVWYGFRSGLRRYKPALFFTGLLGLTGIVFTGHQGAGITHGDNFLLAPVTPDKKRPSVLLEDALAYAHLIKPILEDKCMGCHNSRKAKGELVMETEELLLKGGKDGKLWDTTEAGLGLMMKRIHLPLEEKKHMPPSGKPQLTDEEIKALYYWIKDGASFTRKIVELPETDTLRMVATGFFNSIENDRYDFPAAEESLVSRLNNDYRVVEPVALGSPALTVSFYGVAFFKSEQLKELESVKNQLVSLNLNKMPVTDEDMKIIARFSNLRKLNLSFTSITSGGLKELAQLKELKNLSLAGTKVDVKGLEAISEMEKLSVVGLWNTPAARENITGIENKFPDIQFEKGYNGDTILARLNPPLIEGDEQTFTDSVSVKLKHYIHGVVMRYTIDGSEPDSMQSALYKDRIIIENPCELKVKAFLPGWISSESVSKTFYKTGFLADSAQLVLQPSPSYKAEGGLTLIDGKKGTLNFRDGSWLGYQENDMQAYLYFDKPAALSSVSFSTIVDIGSYIMPAYELEVWGGLNKSDLKLLKKIRPPQPSEQVPIYMAGFDCRFPKQQVAVLKVVAKPVPKLPSWHPGKGTRGWVFIDEIFMN